MNAVLMAWGLVLAAGLNSCIGNLLLKRSRFGPQEGLLAQFLSPWFVGGLFFYGINVVLFAKSLDHLPVARAYPVLAGFGFMLVACAGHFWFGERFTATHWIGLVTILAGIFLITR